jgi:hypothetical protein
MSGLLVRRAQEESSQEDARAGRKELTDKAHFLRPVIVSSSDLSLLPEEKPVSPGEARALE